MLNSKDKHNLESVYSQFMKIANRMQGNNAKNVAIYYKFGSPKSNLIDAEIFEALCYQTITAPIWGTEISIMQPLIPSRGYESQYRTFRTTYWLDNLASTPQMKTETSLSTAISRSTRIKSQIHRNPQENHLMESMVLKVVLIVEKQSHCRVTHVGFDFVQDIHDKIWLLCSTDCKIVTHGDASTKSTHDMKSTSKSAPKSAQELKNKRATQLIDLQRIAKDEMEDRKEIERIEAKATMKQNARRASMLVLNGQKGGLGQPHLVNSNNTHERRGSLLSPKRLLLGMGLGGGGDRMRSNSVVSIPSEYTQSKNASYSLSYPRTLSQALSHTHTHTHTHTNF